MKAIKEKRKYKDIMGTVILNKMNGLMSVHFYPKKSLKIKKNEKLLLECSSFGRTLNPDTFYNTTFYKVPITEAYSLGKFKTKKEYLERKKNGRSR
tara:strand:- start:557 stop:844 length:288 start_codon:yes stop_codon:yes gene_type:complete